MREMAMTMAMAIRSLQTPGTDASLIDESVDRGDVEACLRMELLMHVCLDRLILLIYFQYQHTPAGGFALAVVLLLFLAVGDWVKRSVRVNAGFKGIALQHAGGTK